jgi:hypothetical protein
MPSLSPSLDPRVEGELQRAAGRWRWQRFWRLAAVLWTAFFALVLILGGLVERRVLRNETIVALLVLGLVLVGMAGLVLVIVLAAVARRPRPVLAAELEGAYTGLEDRLNTLVHIEGQKTSPEVAPYFRRIERQARMAVPLGGLPSPFAVGKTLLLWTAGALVAGLTVWFYAHFQPWERLGEEESETAESAPAPELPPLPPPKANAAEVKAPWGEVRITEPGRDLKVTKVDVVPLQVEVASDQPLKQASWFTGKGTGKSEHRLPPPQEPNYAVYKPLLYMDELGLSDWDVLTYYASATATGSSFASEVYFVEVRPFREDILKMPGGEGGKGYRMLNELTGLIERQRQVLRETHHYQQQRYDSPALRRQDQAKLAAAEEDLAVAARHLYAKMAAEMENKDIGDVLTHLARSEELLKQARQTIAAGAEDAVPREQDALTELAATRKSIQKAITDHPEAFGDDRADDEEQTPVAEPRDRLKRTVELRNQGKAALEQVRKTLEEQRRIASEAEARGPAAYDQLAQQHERARQPLEDLRQAQPGAFAGAEKEAAEASRALQQAGESLERKDPGAGAAQRRAVESLEALQSALGHSGEARELTEAYRLREALRREARELGEVQQKPEAASREELSRLSQGSKSTLDELKDLAQQGTAREAFGPPLGNALEGRPRAELQEALDALPKAASDAERARAAGAAKEGLERVGRAFDQSLPSSVKDLQADRLTPGDQEALDEALRQLEGMAEAGGARPTTPGDRERQRRELLFKLRKGLHGLYGEDARTARLLLKIEDVLGKELTPAEQQVLKKLRDDIEQFRSEVGDAQRMAQDRTVRHIDPSRLPASYRDRIQRYFKRLSEQK